MLPLTDPPLHSSLVCVSTPWVPKPRSPKRWLQFSLSPLLWSPHSCQIYSDNLKGVGPSFGAINSSQPHRTTLNVREEPNAGAPSFATFSMEMISYFFFPLKSPPKIYLGEHRLSGFSEEQVPDPLGGHCLSSPSLPFLIAQGSSCPQTLSSPCHPPLLSKSPPNPPFLMDTPGVVVWRAPVTSE